METFNGFTEMIDLLYHSMYSLQTLVPQGEEHSLATTGFTRTGKQISHIFQAYR